MRSCPRVPLSVGGEGRYSDETRDDDARSPPRSVRGDRHEWHSIGSAAGSHSQVDSACRDRQDMPRQGDREPWINPQNYKRDREMFRYGDVDDGVMQFTNA